MAHSRLYIQLMNSRRWRELRTAKLANNPLCERCKAEGYVSAAQCVHHIVEVESGRTDDECRDLCFRWTNLQSLCYQCHAEIHKRNGKGTKQNHKQREDERLSQWLARHRGSEGEEKNPPAPI